MPNLAKALRAEVRSAAAEELTRALLPLRNIEKHLKLVLQAMKRRGAAAPRAAGRPRQERLAAAEGTFKPAEVRRLRRRFGMNRPQFGRLVGVSTWTVFMWEHGKVMPSPASSTQLRRIATLTPAAAAAASARPRRRRGPGRPRRTRG